MKKIFLLLFVIISCAPYTHGWTPEMYAKRLSGAIGCPPEEIKIIEDNPEPSLMIKNTVVECRGQIYYCTDNPNTQAPVCKEAVK